MRRRIEVLSRRAVRVMRSHYMLVLTAVAIAVAGAAALGSFDPREPERGGTAGRAATTPPPAATAYPSRIEPMTVTYFLVGSEEERAAWDSVEATMTQRGFLSRQAVEVLVVRTDEEVTAALMFIDGYRVRYPWNNYVVQDLRQP